MAIMILAVDVGNTSTIFGFFEDTALQCDFKIATKPYKTTDEYALLLKQICHDKNIDLNAVDGAIISSVVAPVTEYIIKSIEIVFETRVLVVGQGVKTGVNIHIENHTQLGSDIVANVAAAEARLKKPFAVIDLGSATTIAAVTATGVMPGVIIIPGAGLAIDALADKTAGLPFISLTKPKGLLGKNTIDSMLSGCIFGTAAMIDALLDRLKDELKVDSLEAIACGGLAGKIIPYCKNRIPIVENLTLEGLNRIYLLNRQKAI